MRMNSESTLHGYERLWAERENVQVRELLGRERRVQQIFRTEACADALLAEREQRFDVF